MSPVNAVVWICVLVFAVTSIITLLYLIGRMPGLRQEHGKLLFKILITEVAVAAVATFVYHINSVVRDQSKNRVPITGLLVIEQGPSTTIYDGEEPIFLRAADVSRARREIDLQIDIRADFASAVRIRIKANIPQEINLGKKRYRLTSTHIGTIDPNPEEMQAKNSDFSFVSLDKIK